MRPRTPRLCRSRCLPLSRGLPAVHLTPKLEPPLQHGLTPAWGAPGGHSGTCSSHPSGSKIPLWDPTGGSHGAVVLGTGKTRPMAWEAPRGPAQKAPARGPPCAPPAASGRRDPVRGHETSPALVPPEPLVLLTSQRQLQRDTGTPAGHGDPSQHPAPPRGPWERSEGITLLPLSPAGFPLAGASVIP